MKLLTRAEEFIMIAIVRLQKEAYCVPILEQVQDVTKKKWTLGGIYIPLHRLEERGFVESHLGDPTAERGGKSKRFYHITPDGLRALQKIKQMENEMWDGISDIITENI